TKLDFKLANSSDMMEALKVVISGEKIKIEDDALAVLSKAADGSFRDGVKFLDQLSSFGEIKVGQVQQLIQTSDFTAASEIVYSLARKDGKEAINLILK